MMLKAIEKRIGRNKGSFENFNRQLRKAAKTESAFVSDDALLKQLYPIAMQVTGKGRRRSKVGAK